MAVVWHFGVELVPAHGPRGRFRRQSGHVRPLSGYALDHAAPGPVAASPGVDEAAGGPAGHPRLAEPFLARLIAEGVPQ
jgi:hypothetical protein